MKQEVLIGGSALPISNFILKEKIVKADKPEYHEYEHGFYIAADNMNLFLELHTNNLYKRKYLLQKELTKILKEINRFDIENFNEELYLSSKKYRQDIKNLIFDKEIEHLYKIL